MAQNNVCYHPVSSVFHISESLRVLRGVLYCLGHTRVIGTLRVLPGMSPQVRLLGPLLTMVPS
jgi:hypothetical protein